MRASASRPWGAPVAQNDGALWVCPSNPELCQLVFPQAPEGLVAQVHELALWLRGREPSLHL